jgi:hypothetical protein
MTRRRRIEFIAGILTATLGAAGLAFALGAPLGTESRGCSTSGGIGQPSVVDCSQAYTRQVSAIEIQGLASLLPAILIFSSILLAIAGFAVVHSQSGARSSLVFLWIFTALLWAMMLLAALSIGVFLLPAALLALLTAILASGGAVTRAGRSAAPAS